MAEPATLAARAEALTKIGAPLLGVIYVLGFIVSALHLARFGVSSVAREIYPHIPATIGGGAPVPVTLHLDGAQHQCNVLLTDKTVVIVENGKVQELPRDSVKSIDHP